MKPLLSTCPGSRPGSTRRQRKWNSGSLPLSLYWAASGVIKILTWIFCKAQELASIWFVVTCSAGQAADVTARMPLTTEASSSQRALQHPGRTYLQAAAQLGADFAGQQADLCQDAASLRLLLASLLPVSSSAQMPMRRTHRSNRTSGLVEQRNVFGFHTAWHSFILDLLSTRSILLACFFAAVSS